MLQSCTKTDDTNPNIQLVFGHLLMTWLLKADNKEIRFHSSSHHLLQLILVIAIFLLSTSLDISEELMQEHYQIASEQIEMNKARRVRKIKYCNSQGLGRSNQTGQA